LKDAVLEAIKKYQVFETHVIIIHDTEKEARGIVDYISDKLEVHCDYVGEIMSCDLE